MEECLIECKFDIVNYCKPIMNKSATGERISTPNNIFKTLSVSIIFKHALINPAK